MFILYKSILLWRKKNQTLEFLGIFSNWAELEHVFCIGFEFEVWFWRSYLFKIYCLVISENLQLS